METHLKTIFNFLYHYRRYNQAVQRNYYSNFIRPGSSKTDNVLSLLYAIANTQSRPNIDKLADFFKFIADELESLESFGKFVQKINSDAIHNYNSLFEGLNRQNGWGAKTSALFTKCIYHIHSGTYGNDLKIWDDVPSTINESDVFYLPVDAVIVAIFTHLNSARSWNFSNVNKMLREHYKSVEIEIWDDLWFWGFITQKGTGTNRLFEWNENKYWILQETNKDPNEIAEIKDRAFEFLNIISVNELTKRAI